MIRNLNFMRSNLLIVRFLMFLCFLKVGALHAALDVNKIGDALGFPADLLRIEEVTLSQREAYTTPTISENRDGKMPSINPDSIISVYRVTCVKSGAFYPLMITCSESGTLFDAKVQSKINESGAIPDDANGGKLIGSTSFKNDGVGGIYFGKVRVPSSTKEIRYPQMKPALIAEVRYASLKQDLQVAMFLALDGTSNLEPVPGGDRYYELFAPSEAGGDFGNEKIRDALVAIQDAAYSGLLGHDHHGTTGKGGDDAGLVSDENNGGSVDENPTKTYENKTSAVSWSLGALALICLIFVVMLIFRKLHGRTR